MIFRVFLNIRYGYAGYKPMIHFPDRKSDSNKGAPMKFSGKKIIMTNREALNSAMKE